MPMEIGLPSFFSRTVPGPKCSRIAGKEKKFSGKARKKTDEEKEREKEEALLARRPGEKGRIGKEKKCPKGEILKSMGKIQRYSKFNFDLRHRIK